MALIKFIFGIFCYVMGVVSIIIVSWYKSLFKVINNCDSIIVRLSYWVIESLWFNFYGLILFSRYYVVVGGYNDPEACIKVGLHKSYVDGFMLQTYQGMSFIVDKSVLSVPLAKYLVEMLEVVCFDRKDEQDKKKAVYGAYNRIYKHKMLSGRCRPMYVFPEGYCISKDYMLEFKPGAFAGLERVQPMNMTIHKDYITGIAVSNARGKIVDFLLWLARSYTLVEIEYLPTMQYNQDKEIRSLLNYESQESLHKSIEANKDTLKQHGTKYSQQATDIFSKNYNLNIISDSKYYDGYDAMNWFEYIINNLHLMDTESKSEDREVVVKKHFNIYLDNHREKCLKRDKIFEKTDLYRPSEDMRN